MPADQESYRGAAIRPAQRQEEASFDALARGLASGTISRRRALRLVGGALFGGMVATILGGMGSRAEAAASLCMGGCLRGQYCCPNRATGGGQPTSGKCIPTTQACASAGCPNAGEVRCGGECTNVLTDVNNCGTCGHVCPSGPNATPVCREGLCSVENTCTTSCCGCSYANPTTGEQRETCFGSLVTDIFECEELCRANTPPGFIHTGAAFPPVTSVCHGLICAPTTFGSRCDCCEPTP